MRSTAADPKGKLQEACFLIRIPKVTFWAPKGELLGSFWALFGILRVTLGTLGRCLEDDEVPEVLGAACQAVRGPVSSPQAPKNQTSQMAEVRLRDFCP